MLDKILERYNLKYEDLTIAERDTLMSWEASIKKNVFNLKDIKKHIASMKYSVEDKLTKTTHNSKQDIFLKARLRNYILIEAFLTGPDKAREQLDRAIAGFASRVKV